MHQPATPAASTMLASPIVLRVDETFFIVSEVAGVDWVAAAESVLVVSVEPLVLVEFCAVVLDAAAGGGVVDECFVVVPDELEPVLGDGVGVGLGDGCDEGLGDGDGGGVGGGGLEGCVTVIVPEPFVQPVLGHVP